MLQDKEVRKILLDIFYTLFIVIILTFLWWGPYRNKIRASKSLQNHMLNQTQELLTSGLDPVHITLSRQEKSISIVNQGKTSASYAISFMVNVGKNDQNTNQNNYVLYSIKDEFGNISEPRNLSLDGYMITSQLEVGQEKKYTIILWSECEERNLDGSLALIANPII